MTTLYARDSEKTITFRTNDNHLHAGDRKPGEPFHLFRIGKDEGDYIFVPEMVYNILRLAAKNYQEDIQTDWPDIVDCNYEKIEWFGIKMSCFEVDGYFVAATILVPA